MLAKLNYSSFNAIKMLLHDWYNQRGPEVWGRRSNETWEQIERVRFDRGTIQGFGTDSNEWFVIREWKQVEA